MFSFTKFYCPSLFVKTIARQIVKSKEMDFILNIFCKNLFYLKYLKSLKLLIVLFSFRNIRGGFRMKSYSFSIPFLLNFLWELSQF